MHVRDPVVAPGYLYERLAQLARAINPRCNQCGNRVRDSSSGRVTRVSTSIGSSLAESTCRRRASEQSLVLQTDPNDFEPSNSFEVPSVGGADAPTRRNSGGRDDAIVGTDVCAGRCKLCPEAGVCSSAENVEGQRRKRHQHCFDEGLASATVARCSSMNAVKELRCGDRRDADLFVRTQCPLEPGTHLGHRSRGRQRPHSSFEFDEDRGV